MRQDANTTNAGATLHGVEVLVWQAYLVGLVVAAVVLIAFPPRRWSLTRTRHRAVLTAITGATLGFAAPIFVMAAKLGVQEATAVAIICCLPGIISFGLYAFVRGQLKEARRVRLQRTAKIEMINKGVLALADYKRQLSTAYPHILHKYNEDDESLLCMNETGPELRFLQIGANGGQLERKADFRVSVANIVSVELIKNENTYTEATTVTTKKGAVGRAVAGELLFGGVGAIVGASSARSVSKTAGTEHRVYQFSELVFGLTDLTNPVVRFIHDDHPEADRWLHRVRGAMTLARPGQRPGELLII